MFTVGSGHECSRPRASVVKCNGDANEMVRSLAVVSATVCGANEIQL